MATNEIEVLIVDDHVITRQGIRRLLSEESDLRVVGEAGDGEQAVDLATELQPDVIIMDIAMPRLNGIEATRQIKLLHPDIAIVALSAYDNDEYVFGMLEAGASGYLLKTSSDEELIDAIRSVYDGEPALDPLVTKKVINRFRATGEPAVHKKASDHLSDREIGIIKLAAKGLSNSEIAAELSLSKRTVEGHMRSIFNKLRIGTRTEAVLYALRKDWFSLDDVS